MTNPSSFCEQCKSRGLPILPVRYTAAPRAVTPALPGWASGQRVVDVVLGDEFHYALRTLRAGYVYLYYDKNARGTKQWECYAVSVDGCLTRQPSLTMAAPIEGAPFQCARHGQSNIQVHCLVIEQPHKCGPTWIAFSEHKWSNETIEQYTTNTKQRNARMQTIHPAAMAGGAKHGHGAVASKASLEQVLEYAPAGLPAKWPHEGTVSALTKPDGTYDAAKLEAMSTRYPWYGRTDQAEATAQHMIERGKNPDGKHDTPHVLALWDAIGITHELNGMRNDAAGRIQQYGNERELEITAMNAIEGVKKALAQRREQQVDRALSSEDEMRKQRAAGYEKSIALRRARAATGAEPWRSRELQTCDLAAEWNRRLYPMDLVFPRINYINTLDEPQRTQKLNELKAEVESNLAERAKNEQTARDSAPKLARNDWRRYEDKLKPGAQTAFKNKYDAFLDKADAIIDARTESLIKWLEAPQLIDTLEDYHSANIADGVDFEVAVGDAIFGMGSSQTGAAKLDEWVKQAKASLKGNLLWRAIALNQEGGIADVDTALQVALADKTVLSEANIATTGVIIKQTQRLADVYKKAQSLANTNDSAVKKGKAFGVNLKPVNTRGADVVAITAGDFVFRFFRVDKPGTFLSEKIVQHIFSMRAFVEPQDSLRLIVSQAMNQTVANGQLLERFKTAKAFLASDAPEMRTAQRLHLNDAWSKFKTSSGGVLAVKDARLALIVGLIEGVNFSKLLALDVALNEKRDARVVAQISASAMTLTAAMLDLASVPAKSLFGSEAWSYQRLKLMGGVLSGFASIVGARIDWIDGMKQIGRNRYGIATLYLVKSGLGALSAVATGLTAFTYAAPLVQRLTGRTAAGTAMRVVGARAAAIVGARVLLMSVGAWLTLGTFTIQVLIWVFTDDALQNWCEECAFGAKRNDAWTTSPMLQMEALDKALVEVL